LKKPILVVSVGSHTRLGDVLETALDGLPFQTIEAEELEATDCENSRILFAISANRTGENVPMRMLTARLMSGEFSCRGAVCAAIADGEQGGAMHTDTLRLLLTANAAGAEVLSQAVLESGRDLRALSGAAYGQTPFEHYRALARSLTRRLAAYEPASGKPRVRLLTALEDGAALDWRAALKRAIAKTDMATTETDDAEHTILMAENMRGLPDERTLSLLSQGRGKLTCLIASPAPGSDLYVMALLDQACVRGGYALAPKGVLLFEGVSAGEALASRAAMERVKALFALE